MKGPDRRSQEMRPDKVKDKIQRATSKKDEPNP